MELIEQRTGGASRVAGTAWRVLVVAAVYTVLSLPFVAGGRPSPDALLADLAAPLVTGAGFALVLMPLARRLPFRMPVRIVAISAPLYWIYSLSNLVEAYFITNIAHATLVLGGVLLVVPALVVGALIAWLFPADRTLPQVPGIRASLGERPLWSWAWRILLAGLLFAVLVEVFGTAWGPLISRYYHDPAYIAQAHIASPGPPSLVVWAEEFVRGVVFALALLPVLAVVRGRIWPAILGVALYVALIDAVLEAWLPMLGNSGFPLGFRLGEGLDLTTDAIARGIFVAALLALPALAATRGARAAEVAPAH